MKLKPKSTISMREWRKANPEKYREAIIKQNEKRLTDQGKRDRADYHLKRTYGLSLEKKLSMMAEQGGVCKICKIEFEVLKKAHVDHCHTTNKIRGVLCPSCNTKLGWYETFKNVVEEYLDAS